MAVEKAMQEVVVVLVVVVVTTLHLMAVEYRVKDVMELMDHAILEVVVAVQLD
jgi:hypothetical protein